MILNILDVITNSSSEVFILHAKPEFQDYVNENIPQLLEELCKLFGYNIEDILTCNVENETHTDRGWEYFVSKNDLIIESVGDNSIPYWIMDLIEEIPFFPQFKDKFNGYYTGETITIPCGDKVKEVKRRSCTRKHLG